MLDLMIQYTTDIVDNRVFDVANGASLYAIAHHSVLESSHVVDYASKMYNL